MSLPKSQYRSDIDGLRAIAVTSVVFFHAGLPWLGGGFVGVDIFFVISGYLIGGIVFREISSDRFSFVDFYLRRAKRIIPALFFLIFLTLLLGYFLLAPSELKKTSQSIFSAVFAFSNIFYWWNISYFHPNAKFEPFLMTWSLGIEEQFYIFLPSVMLAAAFLRQKSIPFIIFTLTGISFFTSVILTRAYPSFAFYLLPTRAWELGVGVLLGIYHDRIPAPGKLTSTAIAWFGIAALLVSILTFSERTSFPGFAAALPVVGTILLLATRATGVHTFLLSNPISRFVGLISYSWYLWHWPLLTFLRICSPTEPTLGQKLGSAGFAVIAAIVSWRFVEQPFRRKTLVTPKTELSWYGAGIAVTLSGISAIILSHGLPFRTPAIAVKIDQAVVQGRSDDCIVSYGVAKPIRGAPCDIPGRPGIALVGDSHANALGSTLREAAISRGLAFQQRTKGSCPGLIKTTRAMPDHPGHANECADYNSIASSEVANNPNIATVIITGFWQAPYTEEALATGDHYMRVGPSPAKNEHALDEGLKETIRFYRSHGKRVIVVGDVPLAAFDPARELFAELLPLRNSFSKILNPEFVTIEGTAPAKFWSDGNGVAERIVRKAADENGTIYFNLRNTLCDAHSCRYAENGIPIYIDEQHLSKIGANRAASYLQSLLDD